MAGKTAKAKGKSTDLKVGHYKAETACSNDEID
jgi:hypothetical protein